MKIHPSPTARERAFRNRGAIGLALGFSLLVGAVFTIQKIHAVLDPPYADWTETSIEELVPGTSSYDTITELLTVEGQGTGLTGTGDGGFFFHRAFTDHSGVVAGRLETLPGVVGGAERAGLIIREGTGDDGAHVFLGADGSGQIYLTWRSVVGGATHERLVSNVASGDWLSLELHQGVVFVTTSSDGVEWEAIAGVSMNAASPPNAGVLVTAGSSGNRVSAEFSELRLFEVPCYDVVETIDAEVADSRVTLVGAWQEVAAVPSDGLEDDDFLDDANTSKANDAVKFSPDVTFEGYHDLYLKWSAGVDRDTNVGVRVGFLDPETGTPDTELLSVDQTAGGHWAYLGTFFLKGGDGSSFVEIENTGTTGLVSMDALMAVENPELNDWRSVIWTSHNNTTSDSESGSQGSNLWKSSGGGSYNADANSVRRLAGDGLLEFRFDAVNKRAFVGLISTASTQNNTWEQIEHSIQGRHDGLIYLRESGSTPNEGNGVEPYDLDDVFRIQRKGSLIRYFKNGELMYESQVSSSGELIVDTAFYETNAGVNSVRWIGAYLPGDLDEDGLPDGPSGVRPNWEENVISFALTDEITENDHILSIDLLEPDGDFDQDGRTNLQEYFDWTDAADPLDFFKGQPVEWINAGNTIVDSPATEYPYFGTILRKNAGGSTSWNGSAVSLREIAVDGGVSFRAKTTNKNLSVGITLDVGGTGWQSVDYSIRLGAGGNATIYENGQSVTGIGAYQEGDHFRIERKGGSVLYHRNGGLVHTTNGVPAGGMWVDSSFYNQGGTIEDAQLSGALWPGDADEDGLPDGPDGAEANWEEAIVTKAQTDNDVTNDHIVDIGAVLPDDDFDGDERSNWEEWLDRTDPTDADDVFFGAPVEWTGFVRTTSTGLTQDEEYEGSMLRKNAGGTAWNADAVSTRAIIGDGKLVFRPNVTNKTIMVGFSTSDVNNSYTSIARALHLQSGGNLRVYEDGQLVTGAPIEEFHPDDLISIEREGDWMRYSLNGDEFYAADNAPAGELIVDTSFYHQGGQINDTRISGAYLPGDWDEDGISDEDEEIIINANPVDGISTVWDVVGTEDFDLDGISNADELALNETAAIDYFNGNRPYPLYIVPTEGNGQKSEGGKVLVEPLTVTLIGTGSVPFVDLPVVFSVIEGGGKLLVVDSQGAIQEFNAVTVWSDVNGVANLLNGSPVAIYYRQPEIVPPATSVQSKVHISVGLFGIDYIENAVSDVFDSTPVLSKESGDLQIGLPGEVSIEPLLVHVGKVWGGAFLNATVDFEVISGGGKLLASDGMGGTAPVDSVSLQTDAGGFARFQGVEDLDLFFQHPSGQGVTSIITATCSSGDPVTFKLSSSSTDSDGDGLLDFLEEELFGTLPGVRDSDGDGFIDSHEVDPDVGTDPNDPDDSPVLFEIDGIERSDIETQLQPGQTDSFTFELLNPTASTLSFSAVYTDHMVDLGGGNLHQWLSVLPESGTLAPGATTTIALDLDAQIGGGASLQGIVEFQDGNGELILRIPVSLIVGTGPTTLLNTAVTGLGSGTDVWRGDVLTLLATPTDPDGDDIASVQFYLGDAALGNPVEQSPWQMDYAVTESLGTNLEFKARAIDENGAVGPFSDVITIAVVNSDDDQDGIPDQWELDHGLDPSDPEDAEADYDYDRLTNLQEFVADNSKVRMGSGDGAIAWKFIPVPSLSIPMIGSLPQWNGMETYDRYSVNRLGQIAWTDGVTVKFFDGSSTVSVVTKDSGVTGDISKVILNDRGKIALQMPKAMGSEIQIFDSSTYDSNTGFAPPLLIGEVDNEVTLVGFTNSGYVYGHQGTSSQDQRAFVWRDDQDLLLWESGGTSYVISPLGITVVGGNELGQVIGNNADGGWRFAGTAWEPMGGAVSGINASGDLAYLSELPYPDDEGGSNVFSLLNSPVLRQINRRGQRLWTGGDQDFQSDSVVSNALGAPTLPSLDPTLGLLFPSGYENPNIYDLAGVADEYEKVSAYDQNDAGHVVGFINDATEQYWNRDTSWGIEPTRAFVWQKGAGFLAIPSIDSGGPSFPSGITGSEDGGYSRAYHITENGIVLVFAWAFGEPDEFGMRSLETNHGLLVPKNDVNAGGNGIPDDWEEWHSITSATADEDGDGLSNQEEFFWGSHPHQLNSDSDPLPDGWEVLLGYDPAVSGDVALADPTPTWFDDQIDTPDPTNGVTLVWADNALGADEFVIESRIEGSEDAFAAVATVPASQTSYQVSTGTPFENLEFRIRAVKGGIFSGYSTTFVSDWDADDDLVADYWEEENNLNPEKFSDALDDPDGDLLTNHQEYLAGSNPFDYYNGVSPVLTILSGDEQTSLPGQELAVGFRVKVADSSGNPLVNAPVNFEVIQGSGLLLAQSAAAQAFGEGAILETVRTNVNGEALIYQDTEAEAIRYRQPDQIGVTSLILCEAENYGSVTFNAHTTDKTDYYQNLTPVIELISGDGQVAMPNATNQDEFLVKVTDGSGGPLVNAPVTVSVVEGGGQLLVNDGSWYSRRATTFVLTTDGAGYLNRFESSAALLWYQHSATAGANNRISIVAGLASDEFTALTAHSSMDWDGDGLTNAEEITLGTDPSKPDSDGDGVDDGQEVADGTNPLDDQSNRLDLTGLRVFTPLH